METAVIGYPRIGVHRELKFAVEKYLRDQISQSELLTAAKELRKRHWIEQDNQKIDYISSNDFSFYDNFLDTACLLNIIPVRYQNLKLDPLDQYFAMAQGYQGNQGDVKALAVKKWFNTNYHYLVPEVEDGVEIKLNGTKIFDEFQEALTIGIMTKPVITGPYTLLKLLNYTGTLTCYDILDQVVEVYLEVIKKLSSLQARWIEFDEPALVLDMDDQDLSLFKKIYSKILENKQSVKILLQTHYGDIRDCYQTVLELDFDGIGLDFVEGKETLNLLNKYGFDQNKVLFAGVINGKDIWKDDYEKTVTLLTKIKESVDKVVINTSCSLLHVPYKTGNEKQLESKYKKYFSFVKEKITELFQLKVIMEIGTDHSYYKDNVALLKEIDDRADQKVQKRVNVLEQSGLYLQT